MKVRWLDGGIRLRITPTELARLALGQELGQAIELPGGAAWSVRVLPNCRAAELVWRGDALSVCLTRADVAALTEGDTEGISFATGGDRAIAPSWRGTPCAPARTRWRRPSRRRSGTPRPRAARAARAWR